MHIVKEYKRIIEYKGVTTEKETKKYVFYNHTIVICFDRNHNISVFIRGGQTFSYSKTNLLKATLPFIIIFGHIYQHTGYGSDFKVSGIYCVALFFFISGYGLEKKSAINLKYIATRIAKVLLPLLVPVCIYLTIQYSAFDMDIGALVKDSLIHYNLIVPYSWFFLTLILLYVVFFLCRAITIKYDKLLIPLVTFALCSISALYLKCGLQGTYHISNFAFLAGVLMSKYEDSIMAVFHMAKGRLMLAVLLLITLCVALHPFKGSIYINVFLYSFAAAIVLSLLKDFTNRFINFSKDMSFELYTCQGIAFLLIPCDKAQPLTYALSIITATILLAWMTSKINHSLIKGKKQA